MPPALDPLAFVEKHGIVLASARGAVPNLAEAVAGAPIKGSWWAHAHGTAIFDAMNVVADSKDVRCFKLVDGKVTFVHRRVWPALVRLADELGAARLAEIRQEHTASGKHVNHVTTFPAWVPADVAKAAKKLTVEQARAALGVDLTAKPPARKPAKKPARKKPA